MAFDTFPCNPYPISKGMLEKGNNDELNTRVTALEGEVSDLNDTKANQITIAPFFSAEASYEVGDLVYYNGLSYRCTNDHEGEWDADDFAATTVSNELATLKSGLTDLAGKMITVLLEYSSADSYFPITGDTPEPVFGEQITLAGRNIRNGAIYALWYDTTVKAFRVGGTIAGDAPQNGDSLYVQYIA